MPCEQVDESPQPPAPDESDGLTQWQRRKRRRGEHVTGEEVVVDASQSRPAC